MAGEWSGEEEGDVLDGGIRDLAASCATFCHKRPAH